VCYSKIHLHRVNSLSVRFNLVKLALVVFFFGLLLNSAQYPLFAQEVSNLTIPSEEELRDALANGEVTIEEFQLLLEYFYGATFPDLQIAAGDLPNLDLIGVKAISQLDRLQQEQLSAFRSPGGVGTHSGKSRVGAYSRIYVDQELTDSERSRRVYQFRIGEADGWSAEGSLGSAYGKSALWRSRSLQWSSPNGLGLSVVFGNYDVRWGTGLAFGRRARLLSQLPDLNFESLRTPDRGGFNGLSVSGVTELGAKNSLSWRALASSQLDLDNRLNTLGVMGNVSLGHYAIGALLGRSTLGSRRGAGGISQEQFSLSVSGAKSRPFWLNAELNTQRNMRRNVTGNDGALATAFNTEWRINTDGGNVRGAFWHYPRSYRNLTGGARSGILYESVEFEELGFRFRDRRINQTGGLVRSVTALDEKNKIETGLEFSGQGQGATRGDYILAWHRRINQHELKLEAGGRTVTKFSADIQSRWRLRAQITSHGKDTQIRAALRYLKEVSSSPALGFFARFSRKFRTGSRVELWLDVARYRWWEGGLERLYSYVQYEAPLGKDGAVALLTKLVYRYSESASVPSLVVARLEVRTRW
jgi:hypothetical protein